MTNKEIVQDVLRRIPDDTSFRILPRELEFIAAVRQGLFELDNGESIPIDQVEQELNFPHGLLSSALQCYCKSEL